jgi:hypothetical protein
MKPPSVYYQGAGFVLYHGDFRAPVPTPYSEREPYTGGSLLPQDYWIAPGLYDAVITDPPYGKDALDLWQPLGRFAAQMLKRGGFLQAILPHYAIPQVLDAVGASLKWRWMLSMWQEAGNHQRMGMGIEVMWKPIGWWVKGAWPSGRGFKRDGFVSPGRSKKYHPWEQDSAWARYCLSFVPPGGTVIDPMVGAGTLMVEAVAAGYKVTGIDCDEAACETTANRLSSIGQEGALTWARWVKASQTTGIRATRPLRRRGARAASPPSPE